MFELEDTTMDNFAKITVVGVGDGGIDAVNNMIEQGLENVGFIAIDSDAETLHQSAASKRVQIGAKKGTNDHHPETSEGLAEESREDILEALRGADMVFIVAGLGHRQRSCHGGGKLRQRAGGTDGGFGNRTFPRQRKGRSVKGCVCH